MNKKSILAIAVATHFAAASAIAGVPAEEAAQLGKTLTAVGAIKAGNADGSIPAYTGGIDKPPASWKPGMNYYPDPYADEKPILKIDVNNMDKYADKLSEGVKQLLKTKPGYYLNVFPSHRSTRFPDAVTEASIRNASNPECKTEDDGVSLSKACRGGFPFPIPKTGNEVMWNKVVAYQPPLRSWTSNWLLDAGGNVLLTSALNVYADRLNYYGGADDRKDTDSYVTNLAVLTGPTRSVGAGQGFKDFLHPIQQPRRSFSYTPGQRRVRLAPEFAYDTPHGQLGGALVYDEIYLFSGAMDRFDFKLVGRKEAYIPNNNYKVVFGCPKEELFKKDHVNPECERWELRRVWVVEATLKPGARHIYKKRVWQLDEDWSNAGTYDAWDQSGKLYRTGYNYAYQIYDPEWSGPGYGTFVVFDLQKNLLAFTSHYDPKNNGGAKVGNPLREAEAQPESYLQSNAIR